MYANDVVSFGERVFHVLTIQSKLAWVGFDE